MDLDALAAFAAVADERHFGRAAERLAVSTGAVSHRIRSLEQELGLVLFERTSRRVELSAPGERLLPAARTVLAGVTEIGRLAATLAAGSAGRVSVGLAPNAGPFNSLIVTLAGAHPELEVTGRSMWAGEALTALREGTIAAAIVRAIDPDPHYETLALGSCTDDHIAVAEHDPLAGRESLSLVDFDGRPFLIVERALGRRVHDLTVACFGEHGVTPHWRPHAFQDYSQVMQLVAGDQGACLLDAHHAAQNFPGVTVLPLRDAGPVYPMQLVLRAHDTSATAGFLGAAAAAVLAKPA